MLKVLERQHRDAQVVHKCMERLLLASSIYKIPVHLQITRTSASSPPQHPGLRNKPSSLSSPLRRSALSPPRRPLLSPFSKLQVLPSSPRTFFSSLSFDYFAWGRLIVCFPNSSLSFDYFAWGSLIVCFPSHFKLRTLSRLQRRCKSPAKATPSKLS